MDFSSDWEQLCREVRSHGDACAAADAAHAASIRADVAAFCEQPAPQSTPQMQMRRLAFAGFKGWWAGRMPAPR